MYTHRRYTNGIQKKENENQKIQQQIYKNNENRTFLFILLYHQCVHCKIKKKEHSTKNLSEGVSQTNNIIETKNISSNRQQNDHQISSIFLIN